MTRGYSRYKVKNGWMHYYFMWHTFLNKPLLENFGLNLEETIKKTLIDLNCELLSIQVFPEKVYVAIKATPILSPHKVISLLKAETFHAFKVKPLALSKVPSLWTRGYFVSTYGRDPVRDVKKYDKFVRRQVKNYKKRLRKSRNT